MTHLHPILTQEKEDSFNDYDVFWEQLQNHLLQLEPEKRDILSQTSSPPTYKIEKIKFPNDPSEETTNQKTLFPIESLDQKIKKTIGYGEIIFINCTFKKKTILPLEEANLYDNCTFEKHLKINPSEKTLTKGIPCFSRCIFLDSVEISPHKTSRTKEINANLFEDCKFHKNVSFLNMYISGKTIDKSCSFDEKSSLSIHHSTIDSDLPIIGKIKEINIFESDLKSIFLDTNSNAELKITYSKINHETTIKGNLSEINIINSLFTGDVQMRLKQKYNEKSINSIESCKFISFLDMRECSFDSEIILENNIFHKNPLLEGIKCGKSTKRKTLRLIKNYLDLEGNHLEANDYFAMEMDKYRHEIKKDGSLKDRIVYFLNKYISDFGRNYVLAAGWILLLMTILYINSMLYHENWPYEKYEWTKENLLPIVNSLNKFANSYIIFSKILPEGREFISLLIGLMMTICMWQLVVALKRYTRR